MRKLLVAEILEVTENAVIQRFRYFWKLPIEVRTRVGPNARSEWPYQPKMIDHRWNEAILARCRALHEAARFASKNRALLAGL